MGRLLQFILVLLSCTSVTDAVSGQSVERAMRPAIVSRYPAHSFAISPAQNAVAISDGAKLCVYDVSNNDSKRASTASCRSFPYSIAALAWSPDSTHLAGYLATPADAPDIVWFATPYGSPTRVDLSDARKISDLVWLDNRQVAVSRSCGTACLSYTLIDRQRGPSREHCELSAEGVMRSHGDEGVLRGMGHAGSLIELRQRDGITSAEPNCTLLDEGCLSHPHWWRYEGNLAPDQPLFSKQGCESKGALHSPGAPSSTMLPNGETIQRHGVGSPASASPSGRLIASWRRFEAGYRLSILDSVTRSSRSAFEVGKLADIAPTPFDDFAMEKLTPRWSSDETFLLVPTLFVESGYRYIRLQVISSTEGWSAPIDVGVQFLDFGWLSNRRLVLQTRDAVLITGELSRAPH